MIKSKPLSLRIQIRSIKRRIYGSPVRFCDTARLVHRLPRARRRRLRPTLMVHILLTILGKQVIPSATSAPHHEATRTSGLPTLDAQLGSSTGNSKAESIHTLISIKCLLGVNHDNDLIYQYEGYSISIFF